MVGTLAIKFDANWLDPDLYWDTSRLPTVMTIKVPIGITNNEDITLYFQITLVGPPVAYSAYTHNLGSIVAGASGIYIYSMDRTHPALVAGEYDENIVARVIAYTDAGYSIVYAQLNLVLSVHHFDHEDAAWTEIIHHHFDRGTVEGWAITIGIDASFGGFHATTSVTLYSDNIFLSSPYSISAITLAGHTRAMRRSVDASAGGYTKARVVFHYLCRDIADREVALKVGDNLILAGAISDIMPKGEWIRISYDFPIDAATYIYFQANDYLSRIDEIWVIAK